MDIRRSKTETLAPLLAEMTFPQSQSILDVALSLLSRSELVGKIVSQAASVLGFDLPSTATREAFKSKKHGTRDVLERATLEAGRSLGVDRETITQFLEAEHRPGQPEVEETLYDELAGLTGMLQLARALEFNGVPVLASEDDNEAGGPQPVFDFTSHGALAALAKTLPGFDLAAAAADAPAFWRAVREAVVASPLTTIIPNDRAALGAYDLFGATLEARLLSFGRHQSGPSTGRVNYTLVTKIDKLIVDWFPQARYRPIQFGQSKYATGVLKNGYYGFQTHSTGSPPPVIDPSVHLVDPQHVKGYTSKF